MPDGYEVLADELRTHAGKVDGLAGRMGTARDAANQVMPDDAYGIICQFLPPVINPLEQQAADALTAGQDGFTGVAESLRESADDYERRDENHADGFRATEDGMR
ncbi:ESX-1 secretion-associated protein [Actinophytocola gossypii]|uniref:ESX-1 secretion-associated protein n=1 Tax=Actinophytocola gossypii TaxID=2812003 RepID=A0ABT2JJY4_9PSEU|nr:ESX-1 secretion-associated protein [Actinophytocola gossypii]MCT2587695.1 ESX-1 secretion-associated protein [Actinophytocola gossypii]